MHVCLCICTYTHIQGTTATSGPFHIHTHTGDDGHLRSLSHTHTYRGRRPPPVPFTYTHTYRGRRTPPVPLTRTTGRLMIYGLRGHCKWWWRKGWALLSLTWRGNVSARKVSARKVSARRCLHEGINGTAAVFGGLRPELHVSPKTQVQQEKNIRLSPQRQTVRFATRSGCRRPAHIVSKLDVLSLIQCLLQVAANRSWGSFFCLSDACGGSSGGASFLMVSQRATMNCPGRPTEWNQQSCTTPSHRCNLKTTSFTFCLNGCSCLLTLLWRLN